jgi:ubiquinone/menaquinone biosynthesis C-methylase UbiE
MDALKMDFPDNSFDLVWGCESGEHMPDKAKYVEEMTRVLKPGGTLVIATWCQRELEKGQVLSRARALSLRHTHTCMCVYRAMGNG